MTMARARRIVGIDPDEGVLVNAAMILPTRIAELLEHERYIADPARVTELHAMRIAAKRLRYTMEMLAPFYGSDFAAAIDTVKNIQDRLGKIHDADVLVPELARHIRRILAPARDRAATLGVYAGDHSGALGLARLCRDKVVERTKMHQAFVAEFSRLRETRFFENLRRMVRNAALAAAIEADEPEAGAPPPTRRPRRTASRKPPASTPDAPAQPGPAQTSLFGEDGDLQT